MYHNEKILDMRDSMPVELLSVGARCIVGSPFILPFLDKEPEPFFPVELTLLSTGELKPWPEMTLPTILTSVRSYFESKGPLSDKIPQGILRRSVELHLSVKAPMLVRVRLTTRASMHELTPASWFLNLERVERSMLMAEWPELKPAEQHALIEHVYGRRTFSFTRTLTTTDATTNVTTSSSITTYYIIMSLVRIEYDLDSQRLVSVVNITEFTSSGQMRGPPIVPPKPPPGPQAVEWRYSRAKLDWVDKSNDPEDDPNEIKKRFHSPEWFAPHFGVWEE